MAKPTVTRIVIIDNYHDDPYGFGEADITITLTRASTYEVRYLGHPTTERGALSEAMALAAEWLAR